MRVVYIYICCFTHMEYGVAGEDCSVQWSVPVVTTCYFSLKWWTVITPLKHDRSTPRLRVALSLLKCWTGQSCIIVFSQSYDQWPGRRQSCPALAMSVHFADCQTEWWSQAQMLVLRPRRCPGKPGLPLLSRWAAGSAPPLLRTTFTSEVEIVTKTKYFRIETLPSTHLMKVYLYMAKNKI